MSTQKQDTPIDIFKTNYNTLRLKKENLSNYPQYDLLENNIMDTKIASKADWKYIHFMEDPYNTAGYKRTLKDYWRKDTAKKDIDLINQLLKESVDKTPICDNLNPVKIEKIKKNIDKYAKYTETDASTKTKLEEKINILCIAGLIETGYITDGILKLLDLFGLEEEYKLEFDINIYDKDSRIYYDKFSVKIGLKNQEINTSDYIVNFTASDSNELKKGLEKHLSKLITTDEKYIHFLEDYSKIIGGEKYQIMNIHFIILLNRNDKINPVKVYFRKVTVDEKYDDRKLTPATKNLPKDIIELIIHNSVSNKQQIKNKIMKLISQIYKGGKRRKTVKRNKSIK